MPNPTSKIDPFSQRRLKVFVTNFRNKSGQLPTLRDLEAAGFSEEFTAQAVKEKILERFYVTLTNGSIVKGFKITDPNS